MSEFIREISSPSLDDLAAAINDEEAGACEFVRSTITSFDNRFTNFALFRELAAGKLLATQVQVGVLGSAQPVGTTLIWSGAVVIGGTNVAVSVFR